MVVFTKLNEIQLSGEQISLTVGNFDGVHRGHQFLLEQLFLKAQQEGCKTAVLSFDPHPQEVLLAGKSFSYAQSKEDLRQSLSDLGVDYLFFIPFAPEVAQMPAEDFFNKYIHSKFSPRSMVIGSDFAFGKNRGGSIETLRSLAQKYKYNLHVVEKISDANEYYSSTALRGFLSQGDLQSFKRFTGRDYIISAQVEAGEKRGARLGFPTANIAPDRNLSISRGVYVTELVVQGVVRPAVTSIGVNPTFNSDSCQIKVETHCLEAVGDIYGQTVSVVFKQKLRDEMKFTGPKQLVQQIEKDKQQSIQYFKTHELGGNSSN